MTRNPLPRNRLPDVLKYESIDPPPPGPGEARAAQRNWRQLHRHLSPHRALQSALPSGIGKGGAGIVRR